MDNSPQILLADDDESDRQFFKEAFEELKITTDVHTVDDGIQLMDYLIKKETPLPHILFLDLNMPFKNGLECLKAIRSNKKLKGIFIAIYSTSSYVNDIDETFRNGANIYIIKPNDFNILKEVLKKAVMTAHQNQEPPVNRANFLLRI